RTLQSRNGACGVEVNAGAKRRRAENRDLCFGSLQSGFVQLRGVQGGGVKPICYDLFCGLGGWGEGFLAEGYEVIGFDIEAHDYGTGGYPGELRLRDILGLHGRELKDATVIVGSSPCQKYSYMAMPWKRAKAMVRYYEDK